MYTTIFEMRGMEILEFGDERFLVFSLQAFSTGKEADEKYVLEVRRRLKDAGVVFKDAIPQEYRPHIMVCCVSDISNRIHIGKIIAESEKEVPPRYAKYKKGCAEISCDPACE